MIACFVNGTYPTDASQLFVFTAAFNVAAMLAQLDDRLESPAQVATLLPAVRTLYINMLASVL